MCYLRCALPGTWWPQWWDASPPPRVEPFGNSHLQRTAILGNRADQDPAESCQTEVQAATVRINRHIAVRRTSRSGYPRPPANAERSTDRSVGDSWFLDRKTRGD